MFDLEKLKIGVQTKGYEDYEGENLVITIGYLGRASNRSGNRYKVQIDSIINGLSTKGIKMIKPEIIDPTKLAGLGWNLERFVTMNRNNTVLTPESSQIYTDLSGNQTIRFDNFIEQKPIGTSELDSDEESIEQNIPTIGRN